MFSDPQSVTLNAVANSLPRTEVDGSTSVYTKDDGTVKLTIAHTTTKNGRTRRTVRLDFTKVSPDPFVANQSRTITSAAYIVLDEPEDGALTNAELLINTKGLIAWATDANLTKVIAGES